MVGIFDMYPYDGMNSLPTLSKVLLNSLQGRSSYYDVELLQWALL